MSPGKFLKFFSFHGLKYFFLDFHKSQQIFSSFCIALRPPLDRVTYFRISSHNIAIKTSSSIHSEFIHHCIRSKFDTRWRCVHCQFTKMIKKILIQYSVWIKKFILFTRRGKVIKDCVIILKMDFLIQNHSNAPELKTQKFHGYSGASLSSQPWNIHKKYF